MLEGAGGNRDEVEDTQRWYISAGTVDTGTRGIGVPGEGSWAVLNPDSDSLQTGWKVGLCEESCAC